MEDEGVDMDMDGRQCSQVRHAASLRVHVILLIISDFNLRYVWDTYCY